MLLATLLLTALGLSADAFSVALCKGVLVREKRLRQAALFGLFFGGFQALMPLAGWFAGQRLARYITAADHWIAFGLLVILGAKMLVEAWREGKKPADPKRIPPRPQGDSASGTPADKAKPALTIGELLLLSVATSIDALAVGVSFAFSDMPILPAIACIGLVTFVMSGAGVLLGSRLGARFGQRAMIAGGLILIGIGVKILLTDLL
jgi:putative Mn2+ efflux pump MntP